MKIYYSCITKVIEPEYEKSVKELLSGLPVVEKGEKGSYTIYAYDYQKLRRAVRQLMYRYLNNDMVEHASYIGLLMFELSEHLEYGDELILER